ncbi:MAG TPA: hypothetical protein VF422_03880 [Dokdonella sp.]
MSTVKAIVLASMIAMLAYGCGTSDAPSGLVAGTAAASLSAAVPSGSSRLRMRVDGTEWVATEDVSGSAAAPGFDRAVAMLGSRIRDDMKTQNLKIIVQGVDGPGVFRVSGDDPKSGVADFTSLDEQRSILGAFFGYDIQVKILKRSMDPVLVEAEFSGYMNADNGDRVEISDGYFFYDGSASR